MRMKMINEGKYIDDFARRILAYVIFGATIIVLIYRWFSHALLHQFVKPVFTHPYVDLTYWSLHLLKIPELLTGNFYIALLFDLLLILTTFLSFFFYKNRYSPIAFSILFFLYIICYNSFGLHHAHSLLGILFISIPFWFKNNKTFEFIWEGVRYYLLFIFFCAFLWKIFRGAFLNLLQAQAIFMNENANYLAHNPDTFFSQILSFFITHPIIGQLGLYMMILIQGSFSVGFFTKKYDWFLFLFATLFHCLTYSLMDKFFFPLVIMNLVLLPLDKIMPYLKRKFNQEELIV